MSERNRSLLRWLLLAAALVFAAIWFLSAVVTGFTSPHWVPPAGLLCLVVAVAIPP